VHLVGIAQSLGLFFVVCLASAAVLGMAMLALARMERATVPTRAPARARAQRLQRPQGPQGNIHTVALTARPADRVSSPGSVTYGPRGR
jgi:Flp pilus assembly protein protease CpaA